MTITTKVRKEKVNTVTGYAFTITTTYSSFDEQLIEDMYKKTVDIYGADTIGNVSDEEWRKEILK